MKPYNVSYDVIGDIHGHAAKLEGLLQLMGYVPQGRSYRAPQGRRAVFLGDLIDRGPEQIRVLEIVRGMVESGDALCIVGNHEFNAIAYATEDPWNAGERLRVNRKDSKKAIKNREQHAEFLAQVGEDSAAHRAWVAWLRTLPAFLDLGGIRVVHGCWDSAAVAALVEAGWTGDKPMSDDLLYKLAGAKPGQADSQAVWARKLLTCGLEMPLPEGRFILDKSGHKHYEVRLANWRHKAKTLAEIALVPAGQEVQLQGMPWPQGLELSPIEGAPIFVGHHWFSGDPKIESEKLACLDWSAARNGPLVGYRWDGESELSNEKLVRSH